MTPPPTTFHQKASAWANTSRSATSDLGAPDVVIEVLSPSTRELDRRKKAQVYAAHGVAWHWMVDGETKSIAEWMLVDGSFVLRVNATQGEFKPEAFPGLSIGLAWLFRP